MAFKDLEDVPFLRAIVDALHTGDVKQLEKDELAHILVSALDADPDLYPHLRQKFSQFFCEECLHVKITDGVNCHNKACSKCLKPKKRRLTAEEIAAAEDAAMKDLGSR